MLSGNVAYEVQGVAIGWHVFTLHHRPFDLGLVGLALFLPTFVLVVPAGYFSDRHDRRTVAAGSGLLEAAGVLAFIVAVVRRVDMLAVYLAILTLIGIARAFGSPAERSLLPNIVAREDFQRVQASYTSLRELIVIGAPALGGVLVALSTSLALAVAAVALGLYALLLGTLSLERVPSAERAAGWRDAFEGLRFIRSRPIVAGAISLDLFAVLFGGATALLPAFADGVFHAGAPGLGALRSAPAVGATIVAAVLARRPLARRIGPTLFVAVAAFGLATIAFGLSRNFVLSLALLAIVGGSDIVSVVIRISLVQLSTPDAMRGRVNAVEAVFIGASNELGAFESGTLAALVGVVPAVVAGGIATLAVIALWWFAFPALRDADDVATAAPRASA
jgi:hypothetical protein